MPRTCRSPLLWWYALEFGLYGYGAGGRHAPVSLGTAPRPSPPSLVKANVLAFIAAAAAAAGLVDIIVWEAVRSDYFSMIIHHISTLSLLFGSFYFG